MKTVLQEAHVDYFGGQVSLLNQPERQVNKYGEFVSNIQKPYLSPPVGIAAASTKSQDGAQEAPKTIF